MTREPPLCQTNKMYVTMTSGVYVEGEHMNKDLWGGINDSQVIHFQKYTVVVFTTMTTKCLVLCFAQFSFLPLRIQKVFHWVSQKTH